MHSVLESYFSLIRRFIPAKPDGTAAGLDIGAGDCKLVQIEKKGNSFELVSWTIEPVDGGDVRLAVQKILDRLEIPCSCAYTSVFGKGTLIRYIDMPRMPLEDLRNSFAIEADKYFPFAQDQIYTDCYILDPQGKQKTMAVMAAAAKKEMVDQRIKLLNSVGLQTDFVGINPIALANGLHVLGWGQAEEDSKIVALLDMGESVSNLTILIDKLPRFTRDIFIGGRDCTHRISNALGIGFEEAEKLKKQPGEKSQEVISACETTIMNIVHELRLSFDYFITERNLEINKLLLTGGASSLEGVAGILEKALDVPVGIWDPTASLKISSRLPAEDLKKNSLKLGVAVGLALYHYA